MTEGVPVWLDKTSHIPYIDEEDPQICSDVLDIFESLQPKIATRISDESTYQEGEKRYLRADLEVLGALMQRSLYKHGRVESPVFFEGGEAVLSDDIYYKAIAGHNYNQHYISSLENIWRHLRYGSNLSEVEVLENHDFDNAAIHFHDFINSSEKLDNTVVLALHDLLMEHQLKEEYRGAYRQNLRIGNIDPSVFDLASCKQVPGRMEELIDRWNYISSQFQGEDSDEVLGKLLEWHLDFEITHPFVDGNGRLGRILLNVFTAKTRNDAFCKHPR